MITSQTVGKSIAIEERATLYVSTSDMRDNSSRLVLYNETKLVTIETAGNMLEFSYSNFIVGTDYQPVQLLFLILLDSGIYLRDLE